MRWCNNTPALLDCMDRLVVRFTMFISGKFSETFPDVVRKIMDAGHEVAAHAHQVIFSQTVECYRGDIVCNASIRRIASTLALALPENRDLTAATKHENEKAMDGPDYGPGKSQGYRAACEVFI